MLDVRRLHLLRELSHRGTIAAVAQALSFTPSAVSQQLAALEREAGVALLVRTGRRVTLTPAAHALVAHADAVLERLEQAGAELAAARDRVTGRLRIGAYPTAARRILPGALARLAAAHPQLDTSLHEIDPADGVRAVRGGDLDVALVLGYDVLPSAPDRAEAGVDTVALFDEDVHLAAPPGEPVPGGDSIARWHDRDWIVAPPSTRCGAMTLRICRLAGFTPRVRDVVDDFATALALVGIGRGVTLVPQLGISVPPAGVTLTRVPVRRTTSLAWRRGAAGHPAVQALVAALGEGLPDGKTTLADHPD